MALIVTLTAAHAIYWTDLRMRAPLVPSLALLAASGISALGGRRQAPTLTP